MISAHWTTLVIIGVGIAAAVCAGLVGRTTNTWDFISPVLGCLVLMIGALLIAGILLIRAWGWV